MNGLRVQLKYENSIYFFRNKANSLPLIYSLVWDSDVIEIHGDRKSYSFIFSVLVGKLAAGSNVHIHIQQAQG